MRSKVRNVLIVAVMILVLVFSAAYYEGVGPFQSNNANFTTYFHYPISINYSGSWNLVYWAENGTATPYTVTIATYSPGSGPYNLTVIYNIMGNLNGSGNYERMMTTYGVGYVENTLCAKATELDSQSLPLTLTVVGRTNSATPSNPTAEVCVTFAV